jgi:hypothetical protein
MIFSSEGKEVVDSIKITNVRIRQLESAERGNVMIFYDNLPCAIAAEMISGFRISAQRAYTVGFDAWKDYVLGKEDSIPKTPDRNCRPAFLALDSAHLCFSCRWRRDVYG